MKRWFRYIALLPALFCLAACGKTAVPLQSRDTLQSPLSAACEPLYTSRDVVPEDYGSIFYWQRRWRFGSERMKQIALAMPPGSESQPVEDYASYCEIQELHANNYIDVGERFSAATGNAMKSGAAILGDEIAPETSKNSPAIDRERKRLRGKLEENAADSTADVFKLAVRKIEIMTQGEQGLGKVDASMRVLLKAHIGRSGKASSRKNPFGFDYSESWPKVTDKDWFVLENLTGDALTEVAIRIRSSDSGEGVIDRVFYVDEWPAEQKLGTPLYAVRENPFYGSRLPSRIDYIVVDVWAREASFLDCEYVYKGEQRALDRVEVMEGTKWNCEYLRFKKGFLSDSARGVRLSATKELAGFRVSVTFGKGPTKQKQSWERVWLSAGETREFRSGKWLFEPDWIAVSVDVPEVSESIPAGEWKLTGYE